MSKEAEKAVFQDLDFECPACDSHFCEGSEWVTNLLESRATSCPDCGSELRIQDEEGGLLADFMKRKGRFGKAMFAFMLPYVIGGLIVSLFFGGLGFMLYLPVGLVIFALLKLVFDNQSDLSIRLDRA